MPSIPFRSILTRTAAPLLVLLALGGCARHDDAPAAAAASQAGAPAAPTSAGDSAPDAKSAPAAAVPGLKPGADYVEIPGGQPFESAPGKIEVVEVFGYTCPHCAHFEPMLEAWAAKQAADVKLVPVAAPFGDAWDAYARAFFTAQAMGVQQKSHKAMFDAIHVEHSLTVHPLPTDQQLGQFYAKYGADPAQFASTLASFPVNAQLQNARSWIERSGVDSTPTLVVDGRYRVTGTTFEDHLRIADALIAHVRASRAAP